MTLRRRSDTLRLALVASLIVTSAFAAPPSSRPSPERFTQHVAFLASDALKGRGNGTPELEQAAEYIASQLASYGLQPAGPGESFFQTFDITLDAFLGPTTVLRFDDRAQAHGRDFVIMPLSSSGSYEGTAVFAGYGITAPELGWDDYGGLDVAGKAVIVLSHDPWEHTPSTSAVGPHWTFEMKARIARQHGARAVLFVLDPNNHRQDDDLRSIDTANMTPQDLEILVMLVSQRSLQPLFAKLGTTLAAAQRAIDGPMAPRSFPFAGTLQVAADVRRTKKPVRNVVAAIPGWDPRTRHEWLVIGAHYDHLGLGREDARLAAAGRPIHHGADDNASGTAGLLELARVFMEQRGALRRSVMFVAFAGEEAGLIGSRYFVDHAPVPLRSVVAMLNLDMIGRLSVGPLNVLSSASHPDLAEWIREENERVGLSLAFSDGDTGSDFAPFRVMGIPAVSFFTGIHGDYHQPSDTVDKLNVSEATRIVTLVAGTAKRIAGARSTANLIRFERRQTSISDREPFFGAEPVFNQHLQMMRFDDVWADSPAARAGLKAGDILIGFAQVPVKNLDDFQSMLQSLRPGDMASVDVQRNGMPLRVVATLEAMKR